MAEIRVNTTGTLKLFDADDSHSASIKAGTISADVASITLESGETVFNEDSADIDFRVEGNGDANLLFIDAGNDKIGIGTNAPAKLLSLKKDGGGGAIGIDIHNTGTNDADDSLLTFETQGHRNFSLGIDRSASAFVVMSEADGLGTARITVDDSGNVGIGTSSPGSFNSQAQSLVIGSGSGDAGMSIFSGSGSGDSGNIFFADGTSGSDPVRGGITYKHDDNSLIFRVDDSPTVTLDSSHNMIFDNSGSGVYLGVTSAAASNLLDDYEEGTHTPTLTDTAGNVTSITLNSSFNELSYTKVGRVVHIQGVLVLTSYSGSFSDGRVRVTLPFTAADLQDQGGRGHVGVGVYNVNFSSGTAPYFLTSEGQSYMDMQVSEDNAGGGNGQPQQSAQLYIGGSFIAA